MLNVYQKPYKTKFYYWTGLQLLTRIVFFGTTLLDNKTNLTTGIVILSILEGVHGMCRPFAKDFKTYQELLLIINLLVLYTFTLSSQGNVNMTGVNIMITMAAVHFSLIIMYHVVTYIHEGVINARLLELNMYLTRYKRRLQDYRKLQDHAHSHVTALSSIKTRTLKKVNSRTNFYIALLQFTCMHKQKYFCSTELHLQLNLNISCWQGKYSCYRV